MTDPTALLQEFQKHQENNEYSTLYWLSATCFLIGFVGLLWTLPIPYALASISPVLNWGTLFLMSAIVYYFIISLSLGIGMVPFMVGVVALEIWLGRQAWPHAYISSVLLGVAIGGLVFVRFATGGMRAVVRDMQMVMLAPAWALSNVYKRLGIPY